MDVHDYYTFFTHFYTKFAKIHKFKKSNQIKHFYTNFID
jgi:hypothetical protein